MQLSLRQQQIMSTARDVGRVTVDGLSQSFDVTPQTIRKDLNILCEQKLLVRAHGGALLASGIENVRYEQRQSLASEEKLAIGRLCAQKIPNDSSLFINIGTTTEAVAQALLQHRNLMVVTNNLNVANILLQNTSFEIIIAGGVLRHADRGITGEATVDFIKQFKLDYAVIGSSALDEEGALLDFDYREVRVTQAILSNARERFLVADKTKLERTAPVRVGHVSQLTGLFMDELSSKQLSDVCRDNQVQTYQL
ncbi:DeoR/GlpR family DNA-binding transcription regulator [Leucothrix pacifica]|uniref:DeoR family transcriptional regulator n=1 Tax=Leucothrix pacifica TaxID=1247513 RepID=A0A317CBS9_9GAMM|nr:DeoR/GlpR family DNA-binding transcription regulator [Leucothrix pacifica]PWQ95571.1 DeoR family transcriptional regulator [Leucothrix pacifica]